MDAVRLEERYNKELDEMTDPMRVGPAGRSPFRDLERAIADGTRDAARRADGYVRENPWAALAIGAGIGCVLGVLFNRK